MHNNTTPINLANLPQEPLNIILRYVDPKSEDFANVSSVSKFFFDTCSCLQNTKFGQLIKFSSVYHNQLKAFEIQYNNFKGNQLKEIHMNNKKWFIPLGALALFIISVIVAGIYKRSQDVAGASIFATTLGLSFWFLHRPQLLNLYQRTFDSLQQRYNNENISLKSIQLLNNMEKLDYVGIDLENHPQRNAQTCIFLDNKMADLRGKESNLAAHIEKARYSGSINEKENKLDQELSDSFKAWEEKKSETNFQP